MTFTSILFKSPSKPLFTILRALHGRSHKPAFVILVATHGDLARNKAANDELRKKVESRFGNVFTLEVLPMTRIINM